MDWHPREGMSVVCVDASDTNQFGRQELVHGTVYTIRRVVDEDPLLIAWLGPRWSGFGIMLAEVRRPIEDEEYGEVPFGGWRFRPLDERRIDVFRQMLAPAPREAVPA